MPRSIIRTAATAIAIAALAAPTALARPADTPPPVAATQKQDARSGAIDGYSQRPMIDRPAAPPTARPDITPKPAPDSTPKPVADDGTAWTTIGTIAAASLLAIGAIAGLTRRIRRTGRARIAA